MSSLRHSFFATLIFALLATALTGVLAFGSQRRRHTEFLEPRSQEIRTGPMVRKPTNCDKNHVCITLSHCAYAHAPRLAGHWQGVDHLGARGAISVPAAQFLPASANRNDKEIYVLCENQDANLNVLISRNATLERMGLPAPICIDEELAIGYISARFSKDTDIIKVVQDPKNPGPAIQCAQLVQSKELVIEVMCGYKPPRPVRRPLPPQP